MRQIVFLILLSLLVGLFSNSNEFIEIPSTSIRIRVIANSNGEDDQKNKKIVKSILEEKIYDLIGNVNSVHDVDQILNQNQDEINNYLKESLKERKLNINFNSYYGMNYFPEKEYRGVTYRAGNYKSYVLTLGEGEGDNWWCVLFPPLCLIDESVDKYEYHSLIKDTIEKYN